MKTRTPMLKLNFKVAPPELKKKSGKNHFPHSPNFSQNHLNIYTKTRNLSNSKPVNRSYEFFEKPFKIGHFRRNLNNRFATIEDNENGKKRILATSFEFSPPASPGSITDTLR